MADFSPLAFVDEPIEVVFDRPPALLKRPGPPSAFRWRGEDHRIEALLSEWFDYGRKGRMERNMAPEHLETAKRRGSWGVGRFYFRVRVRSGRVFDLYYDRAPESAGDRTGHWFLWREMSPM